MPARVPVGQVVDGAVVKLATERKLLTNHFKMLAYQAESDLVRLVAPHYRRAEEEGRTLIQSALATGAGASKSTDTSCASRSRRSVRRTGRARSPRSAKR